MAAARHNLEGSARLSDRDGAGGLMIAAADRILRTGQSWFITKPGGASGFPHLQRFWSDAGTRVRVALAWSHKMPLGRSSTQPTTDLDLVVLAPDGSVMARSGSHDNNYEIVLFRAPVAGQYRARILNRRPSSGSEFIGLAVSRFDR
jgi:hypothetical protein